MAQFCKVICLARAVAPFEARTSGKGALFAKGSIAYNTGWGDNEKPAFLNVTAFNKTAERCVDIQKGELLHICGTLECDKYVDKKTGEEKKSWGIIADSVERIMAAGGGKIDFKKKDSDPEVGRGAPRASLAPVAEEDIPF